jgi:hypothetical protein
MAWRTEGNKSRNPGAGDAPFRAATLGAQRREQLAALQID